MSKIYDVEKMYGQDFSIVTTNAPSNIIKQAKKLLSNTLLISSPQNDTGDADNNMPAMFVTDYNAQPLQLTYPFCMINGLNYHENGYVYINIDNSTIKTENLNGSGKLKVDTNNLSNAAFNKKGVVKLSNTLQNLNRNLDNSKYNNSTFITVNNEGILYLHNDLFDLINSIVDLKIKQKMDSIKVMLNSNLKVWIVIKNINGVGSNNMYNVGISSNNVPIESNNPTAITFELHYLSFNPDPERVKIIDSSNKIYKIENSEGETAPTPLEDNDELYEHVLKDISLIFLPNYFIENNEIYKNELPILFNIGEDKSETLIFQQDKLSNYEIDVKITNNDISINEILNSNTSEYSINEEITLNGFKNITLNDQSIIKYEIESFIVNNSDESNNYLLSTNSLLDDNEFKKNIKISNKDSEGAQTKLFNFIDGIIIKNEIEEEDETSLQYEININDVIVDNGEQIMIGDLIEKIYDNGEYKYYVNIGNNIKLTTIEDQEIGKYYKKIKVYLDREKNTIYGYIYINTSNFGQNNNNFPKHIYYQNRNSNSTDRVYLNNQSDYLGNTINPLKLYCIYNDISENTIYIPYSSFKQYNVNENQNIDIDNNSINIEFTSQNNSTIQNNSSNHQIEIQLSNQDLMNMINDGMVFSINYNDKNSNKTILKSQTVEMNINMLEILLSNLVIYNYVIYNHDNYAPIFPAIMNIGSQYYNTNKYYDMDNYIIKKQINNNEIQRLLVTIPNCIKTILANGQGIEFYMYLYFYVVNNSNNNSNVSLQKEKIKIQYNNSNAGNTNPIIASSDISNTLINIESPIQNNYGSYNSFDFAIYNKNGNDKLLPKLLMIKYQFSNNEESRICYLQDTKSKDGGLIEIPAASNDDNIQSGYSTQLYHNDSKTLFDIVTVININELTQSTTQDIIKGLLKPYSSGSSNICVGDIDVSGYILKFTTPDSQNNDITVVGNNFTLLVDNNKLYYDKSIEFGQNYSTKFLYNYLPAIGDDQDFYQDFLNYNDYSQTPINNQQIKISTGYQIRFNSIIFKSNITNTTYYDEHTTNIIAKKDGIDEKITNVFIYTTQDKSTVLTKNYICNNIIPKLFTCYINTLDINNDSNKKNDIWTKIILSSDNINISENTIDENTIYSLYLKDYLLDGYLTISKNLSLNTQIHIYVPTWDGFKLNNKTTGYETTGYEITIPDRDDPNTNFELSSNSGSLILGYKINNQDLPTPLNDDNNSIPDLIEALYSPSNNYNYINVDIYIKPTDSDDYFDFKHPIKLIKTTGVSYQSISHSNLFFDNDNHDNNDYNPPSTDHFIIDNSSNGFYLYYTSNSNIISQNSNDIIVKADNKVIDDPDCSIILDGSSTGTDLSTGTNFNILTYKFKDDALNNHTYEISCSVKGGNGGQVNYYDKTIYCSVTLRIPDPISIPDSIFAWSSEPEPIITNISQLSHSLPKLTNGTNPKQSVTYSCVILENPGNNPIDINTATINCEGDNRFINLGTYTSGYIRVKISATINGYTNNGIEYKSTTKHTYFTLDVPNTSE